MSATRARTLLILIDGDALHAVGGDGTRVAGDDARLREAARAADSVVVLVPGERVTLLSAPRIARQRARLLQALPYAVEEQLAQPVEDMHVVAPARIDGDTVPVACVAHADMRAWLARLADAGIEPGRMLPDVLALPLRGGSASLARVGSRILVRSGRDAGFVLEAEAFEQIRHSLGAVEEVVAVDSAAALPAKLVAHAGGASDLDLLDGPYRPRRRGRRAGPWAAAAVLALLAIVLGLLFQWREFAELRSTHASLHAEAVTLLRSVAPDRADVPDPVRMMRALTVRNDSTGGGALPLLARLAPLLAGGTTTLRMDALEYRGGLLEIGVTAPDVPSLDLLRERIGAQPGLRVELTGATPGESGVQGRLRVQEAAP